MHLCSACVICLLIDLSDVSILTDSSLQASAKLQQRQEQTQYALGRLSEAVHIADSSPCQSFKAACITCCHADVRVTVDGTCLSQLHVWRSPIWPMHSAVLHATCKLV